MAGRRAHSRRRRYRCTPDRRLSAAPAEQLYRLPYLPRWTHDCAAIGLSRRCDRDQCRDDTPAALVLLVRIHLCCSRPCPSLASQCAALGTAFPVVASALRWFTQGSPSLRSPIL